MKHVSCISGCFGHYIKNQVVAGCDVAAKKDLLFIAYEYSVSRSYMLALGWVFLCWVDFYRSLTKS